LALFIEAVAETANLNTPRNIKAADGVPDSTLLQLGGELFVGHML
jgi:hypothetical protein